MIIEEVKHNREAFPMDALIGGQLFVVLYRQASEYELRHLSEDAVVVVFADGKVHIVARYHVLVKLANLLEVLPLSLVDIALHLLVPEAVPKHE